MPRVSPGAMSVGADTNVVVVRTQLVVGGVVEVVLELVTADTVVVVAGSGSDGRHWSCVDTKPLGRPRVSRTSIPGPRPSLTIATGVSLVIVPAKRVSATP